MMQPLRGGAPANFAGGLGSFLLNRMRVGRPVINRRLLIQHASLPRHKVIQINSGTTEKGFRQDVES